MLLTHAVHLETPLLPEFDCIVTSLNEMSKRWNGVNMPTSSNLASKFMSRLLQARCSGSRRPANIREEAFSERNGAPWESDANGLAPDHRYTNGNGYQNPDNNNPSATFGTTDDSPESVSMAFPPLPGPFQDAFLMQPNFPLQNGPQGSMQGQVSEPTQEADSMSGDFNSYSDMEACLEQTFFPDSRVSVLNRF